MQITSQETKEIGAWTQGEGMTSKARKVRVFSEGNAEQFTEILHPFSYQIDIKIYSTPHDVCHIYVTGMLYKARKLALSCPKGGETGNQ